MCLSSCLDICPFVSVSVGVYVCPFVSLCAGGGVCRCVRVPAVEILQLPQALFEYPTALDSSLPAKVLPVNELNRVCMSSHAPNPLVAHICSGSHEYFRTDRP